MRSEPHDHDSTEGHSLWDRITGRKAMAGLAFIAFAFAIISPLLPWENWAPWQQEPGVSFEVVSETDVLELYRPLDDLDIIFRGQDLQDGDLNLRIITVNIVNSGATHITANDYDDDDWGLAFEVGQVIEARLVGASANYLTSESGQLSVTREFVGLPKTVLDRGHFFTIEVLVQHEKDKEPEWRAIGKISGVEEFQTKELRSPEDEGRSFLASLTAVLLQVGLTILAIITGILGGSLLFRLFIMVTKKYRTWKFSRAPTVRNLDSEEMRQALLSLYRGHGGVGLRELYRIVNETTRIRWHAPPPNWAFDGAGDNVDRWSFMHACDLLSDTQVLTKGPGDAPILDSSFVASVRTLIDDLGIRNS